MPLLPPKHAMSGNPQTSTAASTTATRTYDAFGNMLATSGAPVGPFGFAGIQRYQEDGDSGLKLLGHRYYDPYTGRFLTRDHAKYARNWYSYCENNPLKSTDASGLASIPPWLLRLIVYFLTGDGDSSPKFEEPPNQVQSGGRPGKIRSAPSGGTPPSLPTGERVPDRELADRLQPYLRLLTDQVSRLTMLHRFRRRKRRHYLLPGGRCRSRKPLWTMPWLIPSRS